MKIFNRSKGLIISESCKIARSFLSRFRGLMLSEPGDMVLISPREDVKSSAIHTLFMRFPIDVIWMNSERVVVDIKKGIKPNSLKIFKPQKPAKFVIELRVGKLGTTEAGDEVEFMY